MPARIADLASHFWHRHRARNRDIEKRRSVKSVNGFETFLRSKVQSAAMKNRTNQTSSRPTASADLGGLTKSNKKSIPQEWLSIRARLEAEGDAALAERYARVSQTRGRVLGISVPVLRALAKELATNGEALTVGKTIQLTDAAFASGCREEMLLAVFLFARFKRQLTSEHWAVLDRWIEGIDNWETCDQLAMGVAGEIIAGAQGSEQARFINDLRKWVNSTNPWRRRFAVVATTALNQKGRKDASPTLQVCEPVIADSDTNVQASIAWALREACKSDAAAVFAFLNTHKADMPRTLLRRSAEKLSKSQQTALGLTTKR